MRITCVRYPSVIEKRAEIAYHSDGSQPLEPAMRVSQVVIEPALKRAVETQAAQNCSSCFEPGP
jgi:hypothetical protein